MGDSQSVDGRTELLLDLRESRHRQQEEHRDDTGWETAIKIQSEWKHDGSSSLLSSVSWPPHGHHLRPRFGRLPARRVFSRVWLGRSSRRKMRWL